ncbi:hypothetical protein Tco_0047130 [Tanacetum coccineum]
MSTLTFADTHNMVAFLEKPAESDGFHEIIDFLNANQIRYALTVNPTIYTSCIEQFWATAKVKTVNGERQLQALVDKKKVIITETSIRSDLYLEDAGGTDCLPTATIFEELARMGKGKDFSGRVTHLFATMMVQANQEEGVDSGIPTDSQQTPITTQPSSSRPQKKQSRRKQMKETKVPQDETHHDDSVLAKDAQAKEIVGLKKRVQKLERKMKSRTTGLKGLRKVSESRRVASSEEQRSGGVNDAEMFDTDDLHGDEVIVDSQCKKQSRVKGWMKRIDEITTTSAPTIAIDEITLAQTLIEIKVAKPKAVTTAATTTTTTRPKAREVVVQELSEFRTKTSSPQALQPSKTKDKGKAIMIEPKVPLKKNDQVSLNEEMARNLEAQLQAELIEEERLARKKEEEANIALIESWENT